MSTQSKREAIIDLATSALFDQEITVVEYKTLTKLFGNVPAHQSRSRLARSSTTRRKHLRQHNWKMDEIVFVVERRVAGDEAADIVSGIANKFGFAVTPMAVKTLLAKLKQSYLLTQKKYQKPAVRPIIEDLGRKLREFEATH